VQIKTEGILPEAVVINYFPSQADQPEKKHMMVSSEDEIIIYIHSMRLLPSSFSKWVLVGCSLCLVEWER
jgi:hypothetical protein